MNEDATEGRPLGFAYDFGVTVAMLSASALTRGIHRHHAMIHWW
jgi:hypothetical protein